MFLDHSASELMYSHALRIAFVDIVPYLGRNLKGKTTASPEEVYEDVMGPHEPASF